MNAWRVMNIAWKYGLRQAEIWSWLSMHFVLSDKAHQKHLQTLKDSEVARWVAEYVEWKNTR